jgi:hypothetical protein
VVSDEMRRDDRLRERALETDRFLAPTFVLTAPITLPSAGSLLIVVGSLEITFASESRSRRRIATGSPAHREWSDRELGPS